MPFFQNPLTADFIGVWVLGDRQHAIDFKCPSNTGRADEMVTVWAKGPYNLSGNDGDGNAKSNLVISFAQNDRKNWTDLSVSVAGATPSATTPQEIVTALSNNTTFADYFTATLEKFENRSDRILIKQKKSFLKFWFYIKNGRAESVLKFNARAGVAELPSYFDRHTIANRFTYTDGENKLVKLSTSSTVDQVLIDGAVDAKGVSLGYSYSSAKSDYQLLQGKSGLFLFRKNTVDSSSRITQTLEYAAGSKVGDLAKKISYVYSGTKTQPDSYTEEPYTLTSGDLITPP